MSSQEEFQYQVFQNMQDMIKFADSKSSMSLTVVSIMISITLGSSIYGNIVEKLNLIKDPIITGIYVLSIVIFLIFASLAILFSVSVFKARSGEAGIHDGVIYFGHVANFDTFADYEKKVKEMSSGDITREYIKQNYILSKIANEKMKYVNKSIIFLSSTIVASVVVFILESYISII